MEVCGSGLASADCGMTFPIPPRAMTVEETVVLHAANGLCARPTESEDWRERLRTAKPVDPGEPNG